MLVFLGDVPVRLQEDPRQRLQNICLVDYGNFLPAILDGIFKRKPRNTGTGIPAIDPGGYGDCPGIIANGDVVFVSNIEAANVFTYQHEVDVFVAPGNKRAYRPDVAVELKFFAQPDV